MEKLSTACVPYWHSDLWLSPIALKHPRGIALN